MPFMQSGINFSIILLMTAFKQLSCISKNLAGIVCKTRCIISTVQSLVLHRPMDHFKPSVSQRSKDLQVISLRKS